MQANLKLFERETHRRKTLKRKKNKNEKNSNNNNKYFFNCIFFVVTFVLQLLRVAGYWKSSNKTTTLI